MSKKSLQWVVETLTKEIADVREENMRLRESLRRIEVFARDTSEVRAKVIAP